METKRTTSNRISRIRLGRRFPTNEHRFDETVVTEPAFAVAEARLTEAGIGFTVIAAPPVVAPTPAAA